VASQGVRRRSAAIAILEPHNSHEWRTGLAVNGSYFRDKVSIQKAPLRSAKCADNSDLGRHTTTAFAVILWVVAHSLRSVN